MIVKNYSDYGKNGMRKTFSVIRSHISDYTKDDLWSMETRESEFIDLMALLVGLAYCETCLTYCLSREVCNNGE